MYRRQPIMLYLILMVPRDVLKKLILILTSPPPNDHPVHPTIHTQRTHDHQPRPTPQLRNVVALAVLAAIHTLAIAHRLLVAQVDIAILPPHPVLYPMEPSTVIIHTASKLDSLDN